MKKLFLLLLVFMLAFSFVEAKAMNASTYNFQESLLYKLTGPKIKYFSADTTLAGNDDSTLVTEKAIKTYVDNAANLSTLVADSDGAGFYSLDNQSITNLASNGAGYWFDGVDDKVTMTKFSGASGSVSMWAKCSDVAGIHGIVSWADEGGASNYFHLSFKGSKIVLTNKDGGTESILTGSVTVYDDIYYHIVVMSDGSTYTLYVNGKRQTLTATAGTNNGYWFDAITGVDNFIVGGLLRSSFVIPFTGTINAIGVWNNILTETQVKDLYSNANIPFKYEGASNANLITAVNDRDFSGGTIGNWTCGSGSGSGTFTYDTTAIFPDAKQGLLAAGGNETYLQASILTAYMTAFERGKIYTISADFYAPNTNTNFDDIIIYPKNMDTDIDEYTSTRHTLTADTITHLSQVVTFTGADVDGAFRIGYIFNSGGTAVLGDKLYITNISVTQTGNVADYNSSGVGAYTWVDCSGNENHGTNSGATRTNIPSQYPSVAVRAFTVDASMTDALPADYLLKYIYVENQSAVADTLDFGTTAMGSELATGQVIPASETTVITLNKAITAESDIYVWDTNGNGWGSTHLIKFVGEDVK